MGAKSGGGSSSSIISGSSSSGGRRAAARRVAVITALLLSLLTCAWLSLVLSSAASTGNWADSSLEAQQLWRQQQQQEQDDRDREQQKLGPIDASSLQQLKQSEVVFGIAASAVLWPSRKEIVRLWWRRGMRGYVWLEEQPPRLSSRSSSSSSSEEDDLPPVRISQDTSGFRYTNVDGQPAGIRIARIVAETIRLGLPGVRWIVLCDDDTLFSTSALLRLLARFNSSAPLYIGAPSESHGQNVFFSHSMAFGGAGFALSYPLAAAIASSLDSCLPRYAHLAGSDDRLHACISELGVPLTVAPGFHQLDIRGSPLGILGTHPLTPFISMHHVEAIDPVFPSRSRMEGLRLLSRAMSLAPLEFLQRAICYEHSVGISFSVSLGYVVQVFPEIVYPAELERAEVTFRPWTAKPGSKPSTRDFEMDTRLPKSACSQPTLFFLKSIHVDDGGGSFTTEYERHGNPSNRNHLCWPRLLGGLAKLLPEVRSIRVHARRLDEEWFEAPRRLCCRIYGAPGTASELNLTVSRCQPGETLF